MFQEVGQPYQLLQNLILRFEVPENLVLCYAQMASLLSQKENSGDICQNGPRLSLSIAKDRHCCKKLNDDGSVQVGGEKWWLSSLLQKDKID